MKKMCLEALQKRDKQKLAKVELIRSIGWMDESETSEEVVGPEIGVASRIAGPFYKLVAPQPRKMIIESIYKKEQREWL